MPKSKLDELLGMQISGYEVHQYLSEGDGVLQMLYLFFGNKKISLTDVVDGIPVSPGSFSIEARTVTYSTKYEQNTDGLLDEQTTFTGRICYLKNIEKRSGTFVVIISGKKK